MVLAGWLASAARVECEEEESWRDSQTSEECCDLRLPFHVLPCIIKYRYYIITILYNIISPLVINPEARWRQWPSSVTSHVSTFLSRTLSLSHLDVTLPKRSVFRTIIPWSATLHSFPCNISSHLPILCALGWTGLVLVAPFSMFEPWITNNGRRRMLLLCTSARLLRLMCKVN